MGFSHLIVIVPAKILKVLVLFSIYAVKMRSYPRSPVTLLEIFGRRIFIKRDDKLTQLKQAMINGNKGRKLKYLFKGITESTDFASYGGVQTPIPSALKLDPCGNYREAINLHTNIIETTHHEFRNIVRWSEAGADSCNIPHVIKRLSNMLTPNKMQWVRQGGSEPLARSGVIELGEEIGEFIIDSNMEGPWKVVVASGTGTTAYFLATYFGSESFRSKIKSNKIKSVEVLAVPCVSSADHLREQMQKLRLLCRGTDQGENLMPNVMSAGLAPQRRFATPVSTHLDIWRALHDQTGVLFDLIYAPRTFEIILSHCSQFTTSEHVSKLNPKALQYWLPGENVLYYHCGGVEGNESQLRRYKSKGMLV